MLMRILLHIHNIIEICRFIRSSGHTMPGAVENTSKRSDRMAIFHPVCLGCIRSRGSRFMVIS